MSGRRILRKQFCLIRNLSAADKFGFGIAPISCKRATTCCGFPSQTTSPDPILKTFVTHANVMFAALQSCRASANRRFDFRPSAHRQQKRLPAADSSKSANWKQGRFEEVIAPTFDDETLTAPLNSSIKFLTVGVRFSGSFSSAWRTATSTCCGISMPKSAKRRRRVREMFFHNRGNRRTFKRHIARQHLKKHHARTNKYPNARPGLRQTIVREPYNTANPSNPLSAPE